MCWAPWGWCGVVLVECYRTIFLKSDQRVPHAHLEGTLRVLKHLWDSFGLDQLGGWLFLAQVPARMKLQLAEFRTHTGPSGSLQRLSWGVAWHHWLNFDLCFLNILCCPWLHSTWLRKVACAVLHLPGLKLPFVEIPLARTGTRPAPVSSGEHSYWNCSIVTEDTEAR